MAPRKSQVDKVIPVEDYEHTDSTRVNNPPVGLAHLDREETPTRTLSYDPHLDPQLVWAGKVERSEVEVPAPSIHVHEELSAQKIVGSVRRQRLQQPLFDVDKLNPDEAVEFYRHELDWSNRMILGDSLTVMTSLLERERMGGKVQCVYLDPPYGVRYNSNFQPAIGSRTVIDGRDADLTREPEMIQAYRDTWELGVHSYLSYVRDRLIVTRDLLSDSGSVFVQIGEDNLHRVALLMDEVFGAENRISTISVQKTSGLEARLLTGVADYILWFAKDIELVKYRPLYVERLEDAASLEKYDKVELPDGARRTLTREEREDPSLIPHGSRRYQLDNLTSQGFRQNTTVEYEFEGKKYHPGPNNCWKTTVAGLDRLKSLRRLEATSRSLRYVRFVDDFPATRVTNVWTDTGAGEVSGKRYVVQTNPKIGARCVLMATDPGDLVIDPTCGSGTTAFVCEQYGRRWITIDTSRVALAIARERLMTVVYPYYELVDPVRDVDAGFRYRSLVRTTLGMFANDEPAEEIQLFDQPLVDRKKVRVSGPFTVEALSRYSVNPFDPDISSPVPDDHAASHISTLLEALRVQGVPRPGGAPLKIESLSELSAAGPLQAEGVVDLGSRKSRFAVSLGPQFGAVTMAQVSDALRASIGFDLVVFAGFAVSADAQDKLSSGKLGGTDVALLLANPDLLVGDLLKNTSTSQTFRLYASPDANITKGADGYRVEVLGLDSFDAATGATTSFGKSGIQAWFLDDDHDGTVFRVSQAFFPVTDAWDKLQRALRATVDAALLSELHGWTSLPFDAGEHGRVAIRVVGNDGNTAELILDLPGAAR